MLLLLFMAVAQRDGPSTTEEKAFAMDDDGVFFQTNEKQLQAKLSPHL